MKKFPEVSGVVGMLRDAILSISRSKQEDMALGSALAIAGTLTANRFSYNDNPVYTHLYILNLATTSAGKGATIELCRDLFGVNGLGLRPSFNLMGMGNYSSDAAIITRLEKQRTRIDIVDEFGQVFKGFAAKGDRRASVAECLKGLYTAKKHFAGHETKTDGIKGACYAPAVSIVGTIQPEVIREHVSPEILHDGFLGRFLYFVENIEAKYLGNQVEGGLSHKVLGHIVSACLACYPETQILDRSMDGSSNLGPMCDFKRVPLTIAKDAMEEIVKVDEDHYNETVAMKLKGDFSAAAMAGREIEQAQRIAWILCVSDGAREMSLQHFRDARAIVQASMASVSEIIGYASESLDLKPVRKVRDLLKKAPGGLELRDKILQLSHLTAGKLRQALDTLAMGGEIEEFSVDFLDKQGKPRKKSYVRSLATSQPVIEPVSELAKPSESEVLPVN